MSKICPWFSEEGKVNIEAWEKVGKQLRDHYIAEGPEEMPASAFSLWSLIRDCPEPTPEREWMNMAGESRQMGEGYQRLLTPPVPSAPPLPPPVPGAAAPVGESPPDDALPPKYERGLEEAREQRGRFGMMGSGAIIWGAYCCS